MKINLFKPNRLLIFWIYLIAFVLMTFTFQSQAEDKKSVKTDAKKSDTVLIDTSMGKITVKLNHEKAPVSSENFLKYVDNKHYNGTVFHRVMKDFMIQGGGHLPDMKEKDAAYPPIVNEAKNGLFNKRGTLSMARMNEKDSATAQFFINVVNNPALDHSSEQSYGYAVFGEVTGGMDVVDKIRAVDVSNSGDYQNVPKKPILIKSITRK